MNSIIENMDNYEKQSLSDLVVLYIKNRVLAGSLKSGDKVIEADISELLNTSRAPVREAMRILNEQGIVSFLPRKGNFILEMSEEELKEVFEIRSGLEMKILEKLVVRRMLNEENFRELDGLVQSMLNGEQKCRNEEECIYIFNTIDLGFHRYLWNASGSCRRAQILEGLFYQILIAMNQDSQFVRSFQDKAAEYRRIIEALKKNNLELVLSEFCEHMKKYTDVLVRKESRI